MKDVKIALIQQKSYVGHKKENLRDTLAWIKRASDGGAGIICFPELNLTGHAGHVDMIRESEPVPDGDCVDVLCKAAKEYNIYICAGIAENDKGIFYNTQFLTGPEGYIGKQRKIHLSLDEYYFFRDGTDMPVFELPFARTGIIICFDNWFPEVSRCMAVNGAELLLCPHAGRTGVWSEDLEERKKLVRSIKSDFMRIFPCRAYDNGCYTAVCNMVGRSAKDIEGVIADHAGGCFVFRPDGSKQAESVSEDIIEEMVLADLEGEKVFERRCEKCFNLRTRKPEAYMAITKHSE